MYLFLIGNFEVGRHTFDPDLEAGLHLLQEAYIRLWKKEVLALLLLAVALLAHPFLHWCWNLLSWNSSIYRRTVHTEDASIYTRHLGLWGWAAVRFLDFPFIPVVGLAGLQPVNHYNKLHTTHTHTFTDTHTQRKRERESIYREIHPLSSVTLEKLD